MSVSNGLDQAFVRARQERRAALIPYLSAGYPVPERYVDLAVTVLDAGADTLEIGIPFSDPLMDGPATQTAQQGSLAAGVTPAGCLRYAAAISARTGKPLLFMGAYNPILAYGQEAFCREASQAGVTGLIVPDLPLEEQGDLRQAAIAHHLHLIQMVAPTSTPERLQRVCAAASGFVYGVSVAGVTGARATVSSAARPLVEAVKARTAVPVAVGFGIAGPEQAAEVASFADGVIVGAALVHLLASADPEAEAAAGRFIAGLRAAVETSAVS